MGIYFYLIQNLNLYMYGYTLHKHNIENLNFQICTQIEKYRLNNLVKIENNFFLNDFKFNLLNAI